MRRLLSKCEHICQDMLADCQGFVQQLLSKRDETWTVFGKCDPVISREGQHTQLEGLVTWISLSFRLNLVVIITFFFKKKVVFFEVFLFRF